MSAAASLVLVGLTGTARNQAGVAAVTSLLTRWRWWRGRTTVLVVCAPFGSPRDIRWPSGVTALYPLDLLSGAEFARAYEWAFATAEAHLVCVDDTAVIGPHEVQLSGLRRLDLQGRLRVYGLAAASLEAAIVRHRPTRITIVSGDRGLATTLCADLRNRHVGVRAFLVGWPRWLRAPKRLAATPRAASHPVRPPASVAPARAPERRVLLISESLPMALMFERIEAALAVPGDVELVRVQYGAVRRDYVPPPGCRVLYVGAPGGDGDAPGLERPAVDRSAGRARPRSVTMPGYFGAEQVPSPVGDTLAGGPDAPGKLLVPHLEAVSAWMDALAPDLVVVGNDRWWVGHSFVLVARARGVRTLCVQDGVAAAIPEWFWHSADHVATSGRFLRTLLVEHGTANDRCHVTGQPRYDGFGLPTDDRDALRAGLGLARDGFYVLFATQPGQHPGYLADVATAILEVRGARVLLRPHPSLPLSATSPIVGQYPGRVVVAGEPPIADLLEACDLLVTQHSTVAIEAVLCDRAVITADFTGMPAVVDYAALGLSMHATTREELRALIATQAATWVPGHYCRPLASAAGALEMLIGATDGAAAQRTAALIRRLLPPKPA